MINPRKLAAIDVYFPGSKIAIAEYALGAMLCIALGVWMLPSGGSILLALYFIALRINYVPLLFCAA